jgi:hypothetical protein
MRISTLAGILGLAVIASSQLATIAVARDYTGPRFCMKQRDGTENCGYYSFAQCQASALGNGAFCVQAAMQVHVREIITPRGKRTIVRDAID